SAITAMLRNTLDAFVTTSDAVARSAQTNPTLRALPTSLSNLPVSTKDQIAAATSANTRAFFAAPTTRPADPDALARAFTAAEAESTCTGTIAQSWLQVAYADAKSLKATTDLTIELFTKYKDQLKTS